MIVLAQFAGTSLWFAGNAILTDLPALAAEPHVIGHITTAVQVGFIAGTLLFAVMAVADRFSPSRVFLVSALLAALFNLSTLWVADSYGAILFFRFMTGLLLAGIYPIGMKIAADWYDKGLGKALGFLLGALIFGTSFPHLLKGLSWHLSWQQIIVFTSSFAAVGGLIIWLLVPDGPYKKKGGRFDPALLREAFRSRDFRAVACGYFGHMWELYTVWAFVPVMLAMNGKLHQMAHNIPLWSFLFIAVGGISSIVGGILSQRFGSAKVAFAALLGSGLCALASCWMVNASPAIFFPYLLIWGITVTADSPQFSALTAQTAPAAVKGTALTAVICIGFCVSILSIQLFNVLFDHFHSTALFSLLSIGPFLGLASFAHIARRVRV